MNNLEILEMFLYVSISLSYEEKEEVLKFAKENPEKIDELLKIFEEEQAEIINNLNSYIK